MVRKRAKRTATQPYNQEHITILVYGPADDDAPVPEGIAATWHEWGFRLMTNHIPHHPGTRPWGFWRFERDEPMPTTPVLQLARLVARNDLCTEEYEQLRQRIADRPHLDGREQLLAILDGESLPADELDELDGPGGAWDYLWLVPQPY